MIALRALCFAGPLVLASFAHANLAPLPPPPGLLIEDPEQYDVVQALHERIVRRAERMCAADFGWNGGAAFRACMVSSVDNAIMRSGNRALQAYHHSLPFLARYRWR